MNIIKRIKQKVIVTDTGYAYFSYYKFAEKMGYPDAVFDYTYTLSMHRWTEFHRIIQNAKCIVLAKGPHLTEFKKHGYLYVLQVIGHSPPIRFIIGEEGIERFKEKNKSRNAK